MKKVIIPAIAALLFCGAANAQMTQKPVHNGISTAVSKTTTQKKPTSSTTTSVTPVKHATAASASKKNTAITRKHHHKAKPKVKAKQ